MFAQVFYLNRAECSKTCMQRYFCKAHPLDLQALDQFLTEMQSCSWRRNGSFMLCIYGLVTFFIFFFRLAFDVFRQWCFTHDVKHLAEFLIRTVPKEAYRTTTAVGVVNHFGNQFIIFPEIQLVAY